MVKIPVAAGPLPAPGAPAQPRAQGFVARAAEDAVARSRYNRDATYALGLLPRIAQLTAQAMAGARARALPDGGGLADRFESVFDGGLMRLMDQAPTPEARAMTEALARRPRRRAGEQALAAEAVHRTDHYRSVLDQGIAATRARIAADPDGAEDSFGDLLGGLGLAADGWLGREAGESLARELEGELFQDAAARLIERDPAAAAQRLEGGLWGDHLGADARARLIKDARERGTARAEDEDIGARHATRQAGIDALGQRARTVAELMDAAGRGAAGREDIARAVAQGRLAPAERDEVAAELTRAEDAASTRATAIARVEDYMGAAIMPGGQPDPITGRLPPPEAREIDLWWDHVFIPGVADLPADARIAAEDRTLRRLGHVPDALLKTLRAALYGVDPAGVVTGALRLAGLLADLPKGALQLPAREAGAARAVAGAADELPDAGTAVEAAARRLGSADGDLRDALMIWERDGYPGSHPIRTMAIRDEVPGEAPHGRPEMVLRDSDSVAQADDGGAFDEDAVTDADRDDASEGADLRFRRYRENLKPWEGGKANRPKSEDPGGPTNKGISQQYWDDAREKEVYKDFPRSTHDLTDAQIDEILRRDFFDEPKVDKLAQVPGLEDQAPKLVEQVFDTGVLHGAPTAGRIAQRALDEVTGSDLREPDPKNPDRKIYDGDIGPRTREALEQAVRDGKAAEVNNRMVDLRIEAMEKSSVSNKNPGWISRAESFRIR